MWLASYMAIMTSKYKIFHAVNECISYILNPKILNPKSSIIQTYVILVWSSKSECLGFSLTAPFTDWSISIMRHFTLKLHKSDPEITKTYK